MSMSMLCKPRMQLKQQVDKEIFWVYAYIWSTLMRTEFVRDIRQKPPQEPVPALTFPHEYGNNSRVDNYHPSAIFMTALQSIGIPISLRSTRQGSGLFAFD